jgi:hypothetical protein
MIYWMDPCVYIPSYLSQDHMASFILITYWVRPSLALAKDWHVDDLGFLLVNSGLTLGINSPTLRRMHAILK